MAQHQMTKPPKRPRDLNQWAKRMVDIATGAVEDREPTPEERGVDPAASAMGRKGGPARAAAAHGDCEEGSDEAVEKIASEHCRDVPNLVLIAANSLIHLKPSSVDSFNSPIVS
jgi:hypothetical protein